MLDSALPDLATWISHLRDATIPVLDSTAAEIADLAAAEAAGGEVAPQVLAQAANGDQPFANPEWQQRRVESGRFGFAFFRKIVVRVPPISVGIGPSAANGGHAFVGVSSTSTPALRHASLSSA